MSRTRSLARFAAALVGIVAVALAAATITSTIEPGGPGDGSVGSGDAPVYTPPPAESAAAGDGVPPFLEYLLLVVVTLLALALAWYLIAHRRELVKTLVAVCAVLAAVIVLLTLVQWFDPGEMANVTASEPAENATLPGGGSSDGETGSIPFSSVLVLLLVVTTIFAGALLVSRSDAETSVDVDRELESGPEDAAGIATAAGRAADRIAASDDVDNEVYRAWREMTRHLEVDRPETSTPGEFAAAAVEAGMEREHVDELTRLFEAVRYGHRETTLEVEARAISILRTIEATYADGNGRATGDDDERAAADWRRGGEQP
ncbi:DUF4129 domain-containing protein [Natronobeatus ordinarius]|uniref:DUF4129 domain-containing protein n=1 Tax=Natronobeatus ordinarius TaxID=2963433 RepID=UPI0020CFCC84|nr:DUF4129 domain-containing protein [Natronobeatus ordinarius]